jgi:hypothetical protein
MAKRAPKGHKERSAKMRKVAVGDLFLLIFPSNWNQTRKLDSVCVYQRTSMEMVTCRIVVDGEIAAGASIHPITSSPFDERADIIVLDSEVSAQWLLMLHHGCADRVHAQAREYLP